MCVLERPSDPNSKGMGLPYLAQQPLQFVVGDVTFGQPLGRNGHVCMHTYWRPWAQAVRCLPNSALSNGGHHAHNELRSSVRLWYNAST